MRIRTIKPEYWTDEKIGELSIPARLLFIALLNQADDHGNLVCSIKQIKIHSFPYDPFKDQEIIDLLKECVNQELLMPYVINNRSYLHIANFLKHQKINRPSPPQHPKFTDNSVSNHVLFIDSSLGKEGRKEGKERKGKEIEEEEEEEISFEFIDQIFNYLNSPGSLDYFNKMSLLKWKSKGEKIKDIKAYTIAHIQNLKNKGISHENNQRFVKGNSNKSTTTSETTLSRAEIRKLAKRSTTGTE